MTLLRDDRALLDAFRKGEKWAQSRVYLEYVQKVAGYLRSEFKTMTDFDIDDALQETFRRAFEDKARHAYDGKRSYKGYLIGIARNLEFNKLKKASRKREILRSNDYENIESKTVVSREFQSPDVLAQNRERGRLIDSFYDSLSVTEQKVFDLRFRKGLTQEEAANALNLSRQRVRTIGYRIRQKAFKFFRDSGYLPPGIDITLIAMYITTLLKGGC